jgi:hypothetical protein
MMGLPALYFPIDESSGSMLHKSSTVSAAQMSALWLAGSGLLR